MRRALHARVRPLVERFKSKLLELAAARVDSEIIRIDQALEVALSAYESDAEPDPIEAALGPEIAAMLRPTGVAPKPTADEWLASMNAPGKGRGLRQPGRPRDAKHCVRHDNYFIGACWKCESIVSDAEPDVRGGGFLPSPRLPVPEPAVAAEQGSTSHKRKRDRNGGPDNYPSSRRAREDRDKPQANGHKPITCSKCGYVGGNKRGCGTAHPTRSDSTTITTREEARAAFGAGSAMENVPLPVVLLGVPPPPVRALKPTAAAIVQHRNRLAVLRERSAHQQAADKPIARAGEDDNPNAEERWTKSELEDETSLAEAQKLGGELPVPKSSWGF